MEGLPEHLLPAEEERQVYIQLARDGGEFGDDYAASTPPWLPCEQRIAEHSPLSGAAAKRRLVATLHMAGEYRPVEVCSSRHFDCDPDYFLREDHDPETTVSGQVQKAVRSAATLLDLICTGWPDWIDTELLDPSHPQACILAQLFMTYDDGLEILERELHNSRWLKINLTEDCYPLDGFNPIHVLCDKDQRELAHDLYGLYWRIEVNRRRRPRLQV